MKASTAVTAYLQVSRKLLCGVCFRRNLKVAAAAAAVAAVLPFHSRKRLICSATSHYQSVTLGHANTGTDKVRPRSAHPSICLGLYRACLGYTSVLYGLSCRWLCQHALQ